MSSKMVTDREKLAEAMDAAIGIHGEAAAKQLMQVLSQQLEEGETVPDLDLFQKLLRRQLVALQLGLVDADEAYRSERDDDAEARKLRDQAATTLLEHLGMLRLLVDGAYGKGKCRPLLGIQGNLPRDPVVLRRLTGRVIKRIQSEGFGAPVLPGVNLEPSFWLNLLQGPFEDLKRATLQLNKESRKLQVRQVAKNTAMGTYDRNYLLTARLLESLFRYAGMDDLAQRLRSSRRSSSAEEAEGQTDVAETVALTTGTPAPTAQPS